MRHYTRFRAYQLGEEGSSFSLVVDNHFTLIEAKLNNTNAPNILDELKISGCKRIDVLHITSWDRDHCDEYSLQFILEYLKPARIEYPPYSPDSDTGKKCLQMKRDYSSGEKTKVYTWDVYNSEHQAVKLHGQDILLNPTRIVEKHNDNSIAKLFRFGSFQILSLGDCEAEEISKRLQNNEILQSEVDVLILAHHGSENSVCSKEFLEKISPRIAICSSNYDNKFEHPHQAIRNRLSNLNIPCFTTKTGDIIIESVDKFSFRVYNYCRNNERCKDVKQYNNKTWYIND